MKKFLKVTPGCGSVGWYDRADVTMATKGSIVKPLPPTDVLRLTVHRLGDTLGSTLTRGVMLDESYYNLRVGCLGLSGCDTWQQTYP